MIIFSSYADYNIKYEFGLVKNIINLYSVTSCKIHFYVHNMQL